MFMSNVMVMMDGFTVQYTDVVTCWNGLKAAGDLLLRDTSEMHQRYIRDHALAALSARLTSDDALLLCRLRRRV